MKALWKEYGENLGIALAGYVNVLEPEVIVIGGGIAKAWNLFAPQMKKTARSLMVSPLARKQTKILQAGFGTDAGAIGAALLPYAR